MQFDNTYVKLPSAFFQDIAPMQVSSPSLLLWNDGLAKQLDVDESWSDEQKADYFSGNQTIPGSHSIACAYAGHQFGHFNPQLGDGRAHLLGEVLDEQTQRWDIQLKGSGPTQFSRNGDGRCALKPALREYIMSEAMYALGVPTTRTLAVTLTGESVYRTEVEPGAVVARVAASHIRVGTFQYFAARQDHANLKMLADYTINRHYPEVKTADVPYLALLEAVMEKQIALVVHWMRVGFIHGVMNTDNTAISGETIDYGPCAMMGAYNPGTVYSSIDQQGRYAYGNQPDIIQWNLVRFAECLLPLLDENDESELDGEQEDDALDAVKAILGTFRQKFTGAYEAMLRQKLGLPDAEEAKPCIVSLLEAMFTHQLDYTHTFHALTYYLASNELSDTLREPLGEWLPTWEALAKQNPEALAHMQQANPVVIPRNHHVERVLAETQATGDTSELGAFLAALKTPYTLSEQTSRYQDTPEDGDATYQTFCGT